jgi:hypothetical protein
MSEAQSRQGQYGDRPSQHATQKDPCGGSKSEPQPHPGDGPADQDAPGPRDCRPPCPADERCTDKKKPCPCPPKFVPPEWCDELPPEPSDEEPPEQPEPPPGGDDCGPVSKPTDQLAQLKARLVKSQKALRDLEPKKLEAEDLQDRIVALQQRVDLQTQKDADYKAFYRSIEVARSEIDCFIPTVRCQLELKDYQKRCICDAIEKIDKRIARAKAEASNARLRARYAERRHAEAESRKTWATRYFDFLETVLQQRVNALKTEMAELKGKVDPGKDQCEAYFYLYELERVIRPCDGGDPCWQPDLTLGTYLDCWHPECYAEALNRALAAFNDADANEKLAKSQLEQADALADKLEAAAAEAEKKRREDILAEIAAQGCCAKCPPSSKESADREAR